MPKKKGAAKKKVSKPRAVRTSHYSINADSDDGKIEKVLVENFVSLQKVMTNLSVKFDNLAAQISKLLELFEISAKTMAKKDFELGGIKKDEEMIKKLDTLLNQNKIIARGLTLLHEPESAMENSAQPMQRFPQQTPAFPPMRRPLQKQPRVIPGEQKYASAESQGYQKSRTLKDSQSSIFGATSPESREPQKKSENKKEFRI